MAKGPATGRAIGLTLARLANRAPRRPTLAWAKAAIVAPGRVGRGRGSGTDTGGPTAALAARRQDAPGARAAAPSAPWRDGSGGHAAAERGAARLGAARPARLQARRPPTAPGTRPSEFRLMTPIQSLALGFRLMATRIAPRPPAPPIRPILSDEGIPGNCRGRNHRRGRGRKRGGGIIFIDLYQGFHRCP